MASLGFVNAAASSFLGTSSAVRSNVCTSLPVPHARVTMMADDNNKMKNPLAGLGGIGNIMDAMKKAQEFTSVAKDLQEQLKNTEIEATVRGGQVTVTMTAQQVPLRIEVTDELVAMGSAEVSAAVTEGVIAAHSKSAEYMKEKMGSLTKEFGIPQPPQ